jgi:hypothetical protein
LEVEKHELMAEDNETYGDGCSSTMPLINGMLQVGHRGQVPIQTCFCEVVCSLTQNLLSRVFISDAVYVTIYIFDNGICKMK